MTENATKLDVSSQGYPARLREKGLPGRYPNLWLVGDASLLNGPLLGLVCSMHAPDRSSCELTTWPGRCVMQVYPSSGDFTRRWKRSASICCCVAHNRSLSARQGRFVACGFPRAGDRESMLGECWSFPHSSISTGAPTAALAQERNSLVGALATEAVVLHASPGGQIDTLCRDLIARGSIVWTLDLPENAVAVQAGARPTNPAQFAHDWGTRNGGSRSVPRPS